MPVEIKELIIRAVVQDSGKANGHSAAASCQAAHGAGAKPNERQEDIVAAAVKEVLRILKAAQER